MNSTPGSALPLAERTTSRFQKYGKTPSRKRVNVAATPPITPMSLFPPMIGNPAHSKRRGSSFSGGLVDAEAPAGITGVATAAGGEGEVSSCASALGAAASAVVASAAE